MSNVTTKQVQTTRTWSLGCVPETRGRFIVCGENYENPRWIDSIMVGNGLKAFEMDGTAVRQDAALRHYGPFPGIARSISAQDKDSAATPSS